MPYLWQRRLRAGVNQVRGVGVKNVKHGAAVRRKTPTSRVLVKLFLSGGARARESVPCVDACLVDCRLRECGAILQHHRRRQ